MAESCKFHNQIKDDLSDKVSKTGIRWVIALLALPLIVAVLATYAFIVNADYRFGSAIQAQANTANIKMLEERTMILKGEMVKLQADISSDLTSIKLELKEITREIRNQGASSRSKQ